MISSVLGMFDRANVTREDIEKHLIKVTDKDLEELLENSKSIPPEKPWPGYYIPSDRNFINHSLEKYPDKVYLLKKIEPLILKDEDIEGELLFGHYLDVNNMNKDLYVFLFDSFGCPGTHLCARRGYAIYDRDIKDIVAYHWKCIS